MRKFILTVLILGLIGAPAFYILTQPERAAPSQVPGGTPDLANGKTVFFAGGCASCHAVPGQDDRLLLGGGLKLESPVGTFTAPNISPDPDKGIGSWTEEQFATALLRGTSPAGEHYYPAFPYTTYQHAAPADIRDLFAFIRTLKPSANVPEAHQFPFELWPVRRGMGLWKLLYLNGAPIEPATGETAERGRYLVEAFGHCGECHSPRSFTGAVVEAKRNAGGTMPNGDKVPNLTPGKDGLEEWTEEDIALFLADGTTPEGDVVGGEMGQVIKNTSQLAESDRKAISLYLKSLKPIDP
ncbi:diacylglycerol kinase [Terrihabitans soli]|uniref:Diacylglycerol kinase n=1 Tax=Terrihabitans soli TaxID=708113 RepID=A0A6S6QT36_9HYPH|nr:c-type cytochrome [Terrihabitans soli]BCJ90422.1 diacylglycerol kinase [Terrihabitans soli]